jgi:DUF4097 and DUF4098 domain-containing protein YvlB
MGLRPTHGDEDAAGRRRGIDDLRRVFSGAVGRVVSERALRGVPLALLAAALLALVPLAGQNRPALRTVTAGGTLPAAPKLRIDAGGPVILEGGPSKAIVYTVKATVDARNEGEALAMLERFGVRAALDGEWMVLTTASGATLTVKTPPLRAVEVRSRGGEIAADGIGGRCNLVTGGGDIRVGRVEGALHCMTGAGRITVESARGEAVLESNGGDILVTEVGGSALAQTAAGTIRVVHAGGTVTAITGGGQIVIDNAVGIVTARNMAGPVRVGSAAGVRCESGNGGIEVSNISGDMRVSTAWGNIVASLLGGRAAEGALATGNGDITVTIPSNLGVTIRAENDMADTLRRIISEFPGIPVRMLGTRVVAEGAVNGGGPVLRISDTGGTIFIRRQP